MKGPAKKPDAVSEVRVYRNGKLIYTGRPIPLLNSPPIDTRHFGGGGILRLGARLTPGEYLLQVVVTDKLASKKKSQVAQWVDFEVTTAPAT